MAKKVKWSGLTAMVATSKFVSTSADECCQTACCGPHKDIGCIDFDECPNILLSKEDEIEMIALIIYVHISDIPFSS